MLDPHTLKLTGDSINCIHSENKPMNDYVGHTTILLPIATDATFPRPKLNRDTFKPELNRNNLNIQHTRRENECDMYRLLQKAFKMMKTITIKYKEYLITLIMITATMNWTYLKI